MRKVMVGTSKVVHIPKVNPLYNMRKIYSPDFLKDGAPPPAFLSKPNV